VITPKGLGLRGYLRINLSSYSKIEEEAKELIDAIDGESDDRVISESADLLYHSLVGLV